MSVSGPIPAIEERYTFEPIAFYFWEPTMQIGITSVIGTIWWIVLWFVYIKSNTTDNTL
jgi:hypothetical protein